MFNLNLIVMDKNKIMESIGSIDGLYQMFEKDSALQVSKGNKAAGVRARKHALELQRKLKEFRALSLELEKEGK